MRATDKVIEAARSSWPPPRPVRWTAFAIAAALVATFLPWVTGFAGTKAVNLSSYDLAFAGLVALIFTLVILLLSAAGAVHQRSGWWLAASFVAGLTTAMSGVVAVVAVILANLDVLDLSDNLRDWLGDIPSLGPVDEASLRVGPASGVWLYFASMAVIAILAAVNAGVVTARFNRPDPVPTPEASTPEDATDPEEPDLMDLL